jgi:hypothetical protein
MPVTGTINSAKRAIRFKLPSTITVASSVINAPE